MAMSAAKLLMLLSIFAVKHTSAAALDNCAFLGEEEKNSLYEDGDVVLGGLFPLHYSHASSLPTYKTKPTANVYNFNSCALRWMQTMTFAIKEINQRSDLLPQLKLGFHIRDSCDDIPVSLRAALLLLNGQPEIGTRAERVNRDKGQERNVIFTLGCAAVQSTVTPVIIGDAASGVSMALLRSLGSFHIPLVSYFASCSCLSNQRDFPTFMRTMPSDAFQIRALAQLVSYFGWTWVGVIGLESDYARFAIQLFLQESEQYGVCAAYTHFYPVVLSQQALDELLDVIQMSSSKVIINFCSDSEMKGILREVRRRNITGLQWVASEAWATGKTLWENYGGLLVGTIGFSTRRADAIPGLKQHLMTLRTSTIHESAFLAEFWEELFNCRLNGSVNRHSHRDNNYLDRLPCKGTENLSDVYSAYSDLTQLRVSYNVYKAVNLVAHALQDMTNCVEGQGPLHNGTCADPTNVKPWQLLHYMKHANFSALGEKVIFDQNGDPVAYYDLLNWQRMPDGSLHLVKVGFYDASSSAGRSLVINDSVIQWPVGKKVLPWSVCSDRCPPGSRIARRKREPICCFDCVPCAEGEVSNTTDSLECSRCSENTWPNEDRDLCILKTIEFLSYHELIGIVLCVVSVLGACFSLSILAIFFTYKETPLVRANNMELSFLLLVFLAVCFLVGLLFIGEPTDWLCRIRYPAFGISFALCISCLLAKTVVVLMAFRSTLPGSNVMKWFGPNQQRASVLLGTAVQVIICVLWLLTSPPHANNNNDYNATIIIECVTGSEVGFWCVLGYIGILDCICFLMAFLARKLPDNFNEAKFITFSMLIFFAVWITFIPVYVSTAGKYTVAVHIFAILASAFGLLFCISSPKCYVIILKPDKNSKKNMIQR
ncbi:extracellular calcium-sensing receptor-like [Etheostoma cragini]|uniref:extracellular calcium-sensing receptor-like n=1 Tax=Etheostoma cragini TaxID=417921 RepID=UPI00155EC833|nr:extracellular calcium-sensing receptor-like [Etheostoma cragini]